MGYTCKSGNCHDLSREKKNSRLDETAPYRFSARTFFPHWEHVYILSPSRVSLMVTSSRDSFTPKRRRRRKKKTKNHVHISVKKLFCLPRIIPQPSPTFKKYSVILSQYGNKMEDHKVKESQLARGEPVGYFTSVAEDMNSGLPRTNPSSGQCWTWTRGLRGKEKFGHIVLL